MSEHQPDATEARIARSEEVDETEAHMRAMGPADADAAEAETEAHMRAMGPAEVRLSGPAEFRISNPE